MLVLNGKKLKIKQKPKFFTKKILRFAKKVVPLYQNNKIKFNIQILKLC